MFTTVFFISQLVIIASASNLLLLTPPLTKYSTKSHADLLIALGKGLIESGHDVSILRQGTVRIENVGNISIFDVHSPLSDEMVEMIGESMRQASVDMLYQNISYIAMERQFKTVWDGMLRDCRAMLTDPSIGKRLHEYDLLIVDQFFYCGFLLAEKYNKPFIMFECSSYLTYTEAIVPSPMSWTTSFMSGLTDKMTMIDRVKNVISNIYLPLVFKSFDNKFENLKEELKLSPEKSITEIRQQAQLFLVNSDHIFEFPRTLIPNVQLVGGILAAQPIDTTNIEPKIQNITTKRFGIIAFGSALDFCSHPSLLKEICKHLVKFPDIQWIWSLKCSLDEDYPNIHVFKWIPQTYLLAKENCVLFISHGGLNSIYEAMYHGTPVLSIPMPPDSMDNSVRLKRHGMLEILPFHTKDLTFLHEYITKMVNDNTYIESAKRVSALMNSLKPKPLEKAVHWIEHVLKFGGSHLRHSAMDMKMWELYNLDLLTIALILSLLLLWSMKKLFVFCFTKCLTFFKKSKND